MPDCHALVADIDQAKEEFMTRFKMSMGIMDSLELDKRNRLRVSNQGNQGLLC